MAAIVIRIVSDVYAGRPFSDGQRIYYTAEKKRDRITGKVKNKD